MYSIVCLIMYLRLGRHSLYSSDIVRFSCADVLKTDAACRLYIFVTVFN